MISGEKERGRELAGYNYPELILDWHIHMARQWPQDKAKKKEEGRRRFAPLSVRLGI